ncbi:hypothetical protein D9758_001544 [Tetrapyrgos nigripes]|uniref:DEAD/DEAH-box helicase domain-containing protein n=1 Tax=Tetrapyrgos nigripes TaxID=182062 RepID=A0A8H5LXG5_9AGAR|nr:hypothetical protein D9758_001544 [Tetrapyrgos nigripes]
MSLAMGKALQDLNDTDDYLSTLQPPDFLTVLWCFFELDRASQGQKAPKRMQLEAVIAVESGKDATVRAACGSGKTIAMVLIVLLNLEAVVIMLSPLKLIQENLA